MSSPQQSRAKSGVLSAHWRGFVAAVRDPWWYGALSLGAIGWSMPTPSYQLSVFSLLLKAFAEELFFRALLQDWLHQKLGRRFVFGPVSVANAVISLVFVAAHLLTHSPLWAAAVFFPSLVFGWAWDRHGSVISPWIIHFFYNFCLFYKPGW